LRFVTAASLFDGHDAAINIMRRLIQAQGAEVIHLGHNRSVLDIVRAAIQEDADGIAISSYQGGHMSTYVYLAEAEAQLRWRRSPNWKLTASSGFTIRTTGCRWAWWK
jgi:methylmalonyl-CoA mutase